METVFRAETPDTLRSLLITVLASVPDGMIVIDQTGEIFAFSAAAETLFGYTAEEIIGQNVSILMTGNDRRHHDTYMDNYLKTGEKQIIGIGRIVTARRKDGSEVPVDLTIGETDLGGKRLFTGYVRDVTERQAAEHNLSALQAELSGFSRLSAVGTMASAMAHELNQPLTAVSNYLEAARDLLDTPNPETLATVREALDAAASQSIRAGQIIRKLRDYVSRGEIEKRPTDISAVISDAASLSKIGMDGPLARIVERIDPDLPLVLADRLQIRQVIVNLVKNAIEALAETPTPMIWVTASETGDGDVVVEISDNGPGLDLAAGRSPFDAFYSSKPKGMGLGLSICQTIVEAHGGRIWAVELDERGAVFRFSLQCAPEATDNG
ncbi:MAG: PAS domain S-box protein [Pseudomonadota bacterium]